MIAIGLQDANDSDNIKKEIAINIPASLTVSGFLAVINALPLFKISETELPIFKAITTDLEPVTYYVELLNVGKGTYGTGGLQLTAENVRITSSSATSTDIVSLPNTQIIDLGYIGDNVVWGLNIQVPNIVIQEQNEGYVLVKGIFENGEYHEYLWIGTGGAYGQDGGLQATGFDLKEMSSVTSGIAKATSAYSGTVKLDTESADPTVYIKETVDNLLASKSNTFTDIKTITGITYNPVLDDTTKELLYEGTLPMDVIIPNNSTVPFPVGTSFYTFPTNTGILSTSAAVGVTLKYKAGLVLSSQQNELRKYTKIGVNTWSIDGSVAASGAMTFKTYFVNTVSGNNATGIYQDSTKPYATIDYVLALPAFKSGDIIWLQNSGGVFAWNNQIPSNYDVTIKSDQKVTVDLSANTNSTIIAASSGYKTLTFDMPLGIIKNERSNGTGVSLRENNDRLTLYLTVSEIYWNCSSTLGGVVLNPTLKLNKLSMSGGKPTYSILNAAGTVEIYWFVILSGRNSPAIAREVIIHYVTGAGGLMLEGDCKYKIGDINTTLSFLIEMGNGGVTFMASVINVDVSIGGYTGNTIISGAIKSCLKFGSDGLWKNNTFFLTFINFRANLGLGYIPSYDSNLVFENCSITSTNSPLRIYTGVGTLQLKNSTFEVVNSVPLVTTITAATKTIKVFGVSTNATMISDQEGTGVTVVQSGIIGKDLKLTNYPNTRNDGQLPTNKVLAPDANGNVKLYSIATAPAPYLQILIPDSTLPSTTTNFVLKGAFFTPTMTVVIAGQTVNYITFVSDNEVRVNVTTGAAEGLFAVTLNNGIQAVFNNALLIVLGTVYTPISENWENTSFVDLTEDGTAKIIQKDVLATAFLKTSFYEIAPNENFAIKFVFNLSPLESFPQIGYEWNESVALLDSVSNNEIYSIRIGEMNNPPNKYRVHAFALPEDSMIFQGLDANGVPNIHNNIWEIRRKDNITAFYLNNVLKWTPTVQYNSAMKIRVTTKELDIVSIKFIDLI